MGADPSARTEPDPANTETPTGPAHKACERKIERSDDQSKALRSIFSTQAFLLYRMRRCVGGTVSCIMAMSR